MKRLLTKTEAAAIQVDIDRGRVGHIYFVSNPEQDVMKIGFASDVPKRVQSMQTSNHADLFVYYAFRGPMAAEKVLHRVMSRYWLRKEWFTFSAEMAELVECLEDYDLVHPDELLDGDAIEYVLKDWFTSYGRKPFTITCEEVSYPANIEGGL